MLYGKCVKTCIVYKWFVVVVYRSVFQNARVVQNAMCMCVLFTVLPVSMNILGCVCNFINAFLVSGDW